MSLKKSQVAADMKDSIQLAYININILELMVDLTYCWGTMPGCSIMWVIMWIMCVWSMKVYLWEDICGPEGSRAGSH